MKAVHKSVAILAACFTALALPDYSVAHPKIGAAKAHAKNAAKEVSKFLKTFERLSASDKAAVVALLAADGVKFPDSDADGLPDLLEKSYGSLVCDADSDHDGIKDGDEIQNSSDPNDDDSDNDGKKDGLEAERTGKVSAISDAGLVTVDGVQFQLTDATQIIGFASNALSIGLCVEIEGHRESAEGAVLADKVKAEDHCKN